MRYYKYFFTFIIICLLISCGKKEEENKDEVSDDQTVQKNTESVNKEKSAKDTTKKAPKKDYVPIPEKTITSYEAANYLLKNVTVRGYVADVYQTKNGNVEYLNFEDKYPNNPFEGVIFRKNFDVIGDISVYVNKVVEVTGMVTKYKDNPPQIIIESKAQLKIVK